MEEKQQSVSWKNKIRKRIPVKFGIVSVIIVGIQIFLFTAIFITWGAASHEKQESYNRLKNIVDLRATSIQDYLSDQNRLLEYLQSDIVTQINSASLENYKNTGKYPKGDYYFNEQILAEYSERMVELLKVSQAKGIFVVMDSDITGDSHQGVYIRKNENISELFIGTEKIADSININKAADWQESFRITESERCDYYNLLSETEYEADSELSCLCPKYVMYGDDEEIMTYTVPLVSEKGHFYGVLGFELEKTELEKIMPYNELGSASDNMYYLAYREYDTSKPSKEILSANAGTDVTGKDGTMSYNPTGVQSVFELKDEGKKYIAASSRLDLGKLTDNGESWVVIGVVNQNTLLDNYSRIVADTIIMLCIFCICGGICIWYGYLILSRKMKKMSVEIQLNNPQKEWQLELTGIAELDDLGLICQDLFEKGLSSAKLAETIELINVPIGAVQYDNGSEHVLCTAKASEILELHNVDEDSPYMQKSIFDAEVQVLKKSMTLYEKKSDIYHMISKMGYDKYIRIKYSQDNNKWIMAVMDVTEEIKERKKIEYERDHDLLTHLLNRMAFRRRVEEIFEMEDLGLCAIVMIDLDNLKYFNDTFGHDYGDKYICAAASVLGTVTGENAFVSRMSGDEFLIFLHGFDSKDEIKFIIDNLHADLKEACVVVPTGDKVKLRASAGISWYPDNADNIDDLIRFADFAMYESKNNMKGTVNEFDDEQFKRNKVVFQGSEELNRLIDDNNNIKYAFHPIVDAKSGEVFAYEALMRPQIESLRSPEDVMRLATAQSRLYDIECMTWREALKAANRQQKPGDTYRLFINSIPNHELNGEDLEDIVSAYGHLLNRVVIEIIENEQTDKHCMDSKFKWAEEYGMSIALDDYGTGYSNEATLLFINPKFVKIDMSMVKNIHVDDNRQKIVQNLLSYTKPRDIKVIAEGIENYEDMATLISIGVDYLQGWYFTKPIFEIKPIDEKFKKEIIECNKNKVWIS